MSTPRCSASSIRSPTSSSTRARCCPRTTRLRRNAPTMDGFVWDYCNNFVSLNKRNPTFEEYRVIMDSFTPEQLPVINALAKGFAVYDTWFCSVPTQTLPNRSFFHASSSSGFVVNQGKGGYEKWPLANNAPTIFNRLSDAGNDLARLLRRNSDRADDRADPRHDAGASTGTRTSTRWTSSTRTSPTGHYRRTRSSSRAVSTTTTTTTRRRHWRPNVPIGGWSDVRAGDLLVHDIYTAIKASATRRDRTR